MNVDRKIVHNGFIALYILCCNVSLKQMNALGFLRVFYAIYECKGRFMLDFVGNPEDRFSHDAAHIKDTFVTASYTPS